MDCIKPTVEEIQFCMNDPACIRNVCILAHVDHGKTTVADSLLATNRLVSKRLAGSLRYLDDRPDEQERGITMKSSAVSLLNVVFDEIEDKNKKVLLNLIDTPGHIDFSTEVGAALRVCDGAIILVDLVEGVCVQTRESIKNAYEQHAKMILVLNKFDRLVVELKKNVDEIFQCILRVIEGCNAIIAELYQYDFTHNDIDIEDTGLLFSPDTGNVIFSSAIDGWGFTTKQMSNLFVNLVKNETVDSLNKKMWNFDCYINASKEIKTGAIEKKKCPLFVQFCLKTIVHIYETFILRMEKDKTQTILEKLKIKNVTRDMTHNDPKIQVRAILQAWKPLASTILLQCLEQIPSPSKMEQAKIEYLLNINKFCEDPYFNKCVESVKPHLENISSKDDITSVSYVSKMFCINKKNLSQSKPKPFVIRPRNLEATPKVENIESASKVTSQENQVTSETSDSISDEISVVALARVFSGTLRIGQEIFAMTGSYLPDEIKIKEDSENFMQNNPHVNKVTIKELYMLFGRELTLVDSVPAGNFCGIGGLESCVLRTATLSSDLNVVPLVESLRIEPVMRHAIEPTNPKDLPILRQGLKFLIQSDSCVQVIIQETGELVLLTAGDVHLGKCIEDLKNKFAPIDIHVSSPMVALRETLIPAQNDAHFSKLISNSVSVETKHLNLEVVAVSLPANILEVIKNNHDLLKMVEDHQYKSLIDIAKQSFGNNSNVNTEMLEKSFKSEATKKAILHAKEQLESVESLGASCWQNLQNKIWSVGATGTFVNLLVNNTVNYNHNIFLELNSMDKRALFDHCIIKAFNTLCKAGPLCEEPLANCAFIVNKFELCSEINSEDITPQTTSAIESTVKDTFKRAFEKQEQRLMEPMFVTEIQVNTSILGKVYTVVSKRNGKIIDDVCMDDLEKIFLVKAQIPVIESQGFAGEVRKTTSGQANPNLRFSHYEIIDGDPFYEPVEDEDDEDETINVDSALRANKLRKDVRRRKGLHVEDEVVIHAEKQRTLNKKK
ncbi:elongation factor-like GTPase 1 [Diabrotica virgifera virgifera]|uniref:Tr-type G domain-containing protein n=1 Tax=Diabrotica virgifera virgifera TaxID=50390 RepID=A0ABM5KL37_DIAVI|nr:elongation factor-like GTPase 1 [Diabrotica virgifera virgifera]